MRAVVLDPEGNAALSDPDRANARLGARVRPLRLARQEALATYRIGLEGVADPPRDTLEATVVP